MDLTTPVTMDQVVKERERKERVGRGRNGQTTSLDEIEPLEPQRAQHTNPGGQPTPHSPLLTLSIVAAATADCRLQTALQLHCPARHTGSQWRLAWPKLDWAAGWLAGWLKGGGRLDGWMPLDAHSATGGLDDGGSVRCN